MRCLILALIVALMMRSARLFPEKNESYLNYLDLILTILVFLFIAFGLALGVGWYILWKDLRTRSNVVSTGINDRLVTGRIFDLEGEAQEPLVRLQERVPFRPRSASIRRRILAQVERLRQELLDLDTVIIV
uniref:Uncharacterized protein n=1 Tax=Acrobeloides nanus TaxID=290746 RepID=A0A914CNC6_9BILA